VTTHAPLVHPPARARLRMSPLVVRIVSGVVLAAALVGLLLLGLYGLYAVLVIIGGVGLWEFKGLSARMGYQAPLWLMYPLCACFVFGGTLLKQLPLELVLSVALIGGLSVFLFLPTRRGGLGRWAMGVAGALYLGLPLSYYLQLFTRASWPRNVEWILLIVATVAVSDSAAYLVGRSFGRHPFFKEISPHKTIEGAVGGLLLAVPVMLLGGMYVLGLSPLHGAVLGLLVGIVAVLGDLVESQMKRLARVKDSSHLIPGHGGMLDRLDSLLFPPIVVILYASLFALHL
jgi:phosphatidate cytidylyltransferase